MKDYKTKQIFINGRFLGRTITGVERYATELVKGIDSLIDCGVIDSTLFSFVLLAPKNTKYEVELKHIPLKQVGYLSGHLWEQFEFPFYSPSVLRVSLCNTGGLLSRNQIVTIHDAVVFGFPQAYSFIFRLWYKILWKSLGFVTKKILTVSFFSKHELIKYCGISEEKLQVIYEGKEHVFFTNSAPKILEDQNLLGKCFVLAVSSMNLNKNFHSVVCAIELLGSGSFDIAIAGGLNSKVFKRSPKPLSSRVKYLGYVSDGELRSLYEHAYCFVYPSFYEGFGLPPLEAMACGCPVIVSNAASLPEVCADAALYFDPHNPRDLAEKIAILMEDAKLREDLRRKGLDRAKQFTWQKCAQETFSVIESVLIS